MGEGKGNSGNHLPDLRIRIFECQRNEKQGPGNEKDKDKKGCEGFAVDHVASLILVC